MRTNQVFSVGNDLRVHQTTRIHTHLTATEALLYTAITKPTNPMMTMTKTMTYIVDWKGKKKCTLLDRFHTVNLISRNLQCAHTIVLIKCDRMNDEMTETVWIHQCLCLAYQALVRLIRWAYKSCILNVCHLTWTMRNKRTRTNVHFDANLNLPLKQTTAYIFYHYVLINAMEIYTNHKKRAILCSFLREKKIFFALRTCICIIRLNIVTKNGSKGTTFYCDCVA